MRLSFVPEETWPALAWVAICRPGRAGFSFPGVTVHHGRDVETDPAWFVEGVWDGPFENGEFDRTDLFFGSGARLRQGGITFVSSASVVDRLQYMYSGHEVLVSNSFVALLSVAGADVDPLYTRYYRDFNSVTAGYRRYKPTVETTRGPISLVYYRNLVWDGERLSLHDKPNGDRRFPEFHHYESFLGNAMSGLMSNATARSRRRSLATIGTLSNGYDSTATTSLASRYGLRTAISFLEKDEDSARNLEELADALGLELHLADRYEALNSEMPEVPFLASGAYGYEMQFKVYERLLHGSVLFTGYYGDVIWESDPKTPARPDLSRRSQSGLSLTEFRLSAGFIHCPVPFLGARNPSDLQSISGSAEMARWRLGRPGYDRPIARRIAEESGAPRHTFGYRKMVGSITPRTRRNFTRESYSDFLLWLERATPGRHRSPLLLSALSKAPKQLLGQLGQLRRRGGSNGADSSALQKFFDRLRVYGQEDPLYKFTYPWAVTRHAGRSRFRSRARTTSLEIRVGAAAIPRDTLVVD